MGYFLSKIQCLKHPHKKKKKKIVKTCLLVVEIGSLGNLYTTSGYINLNVNIPGSTAKGLARCHPWSPPRARQHQHQRDQWTKWRSSLALHVASSSLLCSVSGWSAWSGPTNAYRILKCITENFQFASTQKLGGAVLIYFIHKYFKETKTAKISRKKKNIKKE